MSDASTAPLPDDEKPARAGRTLRFAAENVYTFLTVGGLAAGYAAWSAREVVRAGNAVGPALWAVLAAGSALVAGSALLMVLRGREVRRIRRAREERERAEVLLAESRRERRRHAHRLDGSASESLRLAEERLAGALVEEAGAPRSAKGPSEGPADEGRASGVAPSAIAAAADGMDAALKEHLGPARRSAAREYAGSLAWMLLVALFLRSFVAEAYFIPSGSMIPTFQVGDHIFINKFIYGLRVPGTDIKIGMGLRTPRPGEVIVFKHPRHPDTDLIKRVVGVAGDLVEIRDNRLYINGAPAPRTPGGRPCEYDDKIDEQTDRWEHRFCDAFTERLGDHEFTTLYDPGDAAAEGRSWAPVRVPPGHVFVMGDNRDRSSDSRYWGFVPLELIRGKAMIIWWSSGQPEGIRMGRMGHLVE